MFFMLFFHLCCTAIKSIWSCVSLFIGSSIFFPVSLNVAVFSIGFLKYVFASAKLYFLHSSIHLLLFHVICSDCLCMLAVFGSTVHFPISFLSSLFFAFLIFAFQSPSMYVGPLFITFLVILSMVLYTISFSSSGLSACGIYMLIRFMFKDHLSVSCIILSVWGIISSTYLL